jgi:recombination protein RecR
MNHAAESVKLCSTCGNLDAVDPCCICSDKGRTKNLICVVESVPDLWALERTLVFRGNYHVLGGLLSAMEGAGPEDLRMESLVSRARDGASEIIIALPPTVDGATTSHYLCDRLAPTGVPVTRLGQGVPMGGSLENLDEGTIAAALRGRRAAA